LHSKNSSGYDEISMKTLNISAPYISSPLCYIFNKAVLAGKFPLRMKYSIVRVMMGLKQRGTCRPVFKKTKHINIGLPIYIIFDDFYDK
jgi:hypothetical protein